MCMFTRRPIGLIAALACAVIVAAHGASAATLYVDAANSSIENGSAASPFNTIQEAIDAAAEDDTISVAPGIYYGQISLNRGFKLLSQQGPQSTIIEGDLSGYYVNAYHNYYINGFTLGGVSLVRTWEVVVENCIFNANPHFYISLGAGFTARRCVITGSPYWIAVHTMFNGGPRFENVTMDGVDVAFRAVYSTVRPYNVSISNANTAFYFNDGMWGSVYGSNVNCWNCQQFTNGPTLVNIANTSFNNPLYVAPPEDFRLQAGSPLIDAGIDIGLPYVGSAPDIGAYEFTEIPLTEKVENLAASFAGTPAEIFREPGEQRKVALYQKFEAILKMVYMPETGVNNPGARANVLNGCLAKLQNDILDKTDGENGGNPNNDWLESGPEKTELYQQVLAVVGDIEAEIAANQ